MSYLEIPPNFYQMLQPNAPWHPGARGWTKAPWVTWGNNPNLVGQPRLGVGEEAKNESILPLLFVAASVVGILVAAGGAIGASAAGSKSSPRHRANQRPSGKAQKYYVIDQVQRGLWYQVGSFYYKKDAERFRAGLSGKTRMLRTYPGHNYPAQ